MTRKVSDGKTNREQRSDGCKHISSTTSRSGQPAHKLVSSLGMPMISARVSAYEACAHQKRADLSVAFPDSVCSCS